MKKVKQNTESFGLQTTKLIKGIQKKKKEQKATQLVQQWLQKNKDKILLQQEDENGDDDMQFEDSSLDQWNLFKQKVNDEDLLLQLESNIQDSSDEFFSNFISPISLIEWFKTIWEKRPYFWKNRTNFFQSLDKQIPIHISNATIPPKSSEIFPIHSDSVPANLLPLIMHLESFFGFACSLEWIKVKQRHTLRYHKWNQFFVCCKQSCSVELYEPLMDEEALPMNSSNPNALDNHLVKNKPSQKQTLQLFDMIYVPRGYIYVIQNNSTEKDVWVLSIQIETKTWSQFLKQAMDVAIQKCEEEELQFRRSLPRRMHVFCSGTNERLQQSRFKSSFVTHFMNSFFQAQHQVNNLLPFGEVVDVFTSEFMKRRKAQKVNEKLNKMNKIQIYEYNAEKNEIHVLVKDLECIISCSLHDKELVLPMQILPILDSWVHAKQYTFTLQQLQEEYDQVEFSAAEWKELLSALLEHQIIFSAK